MKTVQVNIQGTSGILLHNDNLEWADSVNEWVSKNKKKTVPGDDRYPSWRWQGCLYYDDFKTGNVIIPAENIMRCLMEGGAQVILRKQTTYKSLTQSGLTIPSFGWPLLVKGKPIAMSALTDLRNDDLPFSEQVANARKLGFDLHIKRAPIGKSKHVRVRPRFDNWSCSGEIVLLDDQMTPEALQEILNICGSYKGLGDWRPGGKTPGQWGRFEATVTKV